MRILIAEDDDVSRFMTVRAVEALGHECVHAQDGDAAWEAFLERAPDVVISDWMMPGCDGIQLCRRIRTHDQRAYTYFIILTALSEREYRLEGMMAGADDFLSKPLDRNDLQLRLIAAKRVTELHQRLAQQQRELERLNREFYESGRIDALTGIANRLRMEEDLRTIEARAQRFGDSFCFVLFDIDHFKDYNDSRGHLDGDNVLRTVARALASACRSGDSVYRYGGEEFLAILNTADLTLAATVAGRMREAVERCALPHPRSSVSDYVTVSAGVAAYRAGKVADASGALRHADQALLAAKRAGRNRVIVDASAPSIVASTG